MRKALKIFLLLATSVMIFASCKTENDGPNSNTDGNIADSDAIYAPGIDVSLVVPSGKDYNGVIDVYNEIYAKAGVLCKIKDDSTSVDNHEIVFGDTDREISKQAKAALNQALGREKDRWEADGKDVSFLMGCLVYAKGNSVAIVWTDELAHSFATDYFVKNYIVNNSLKLENGHKKAIFFDYIEALKADEQQNRKNELEIIGTQHGTEVADALDKYLAIFDERFYLWLADLYDPGEYDENGNPLGGGFYYSNSGRNTLGYGVDLESTAEAMTFLTTSGMAKNEAQLRKILPESMFREIAAFAKSCQSSLDGYFYHPQWGMNIGTSRLSRDLGWATKLLALCGERPYWNTPNGVSGTLGAPGTAPASRLQGRLSQNVDVAVSKVVPTASTWTGSYWLADVESWEEYLLSFKDTISTSSYSIGNTFDAQKSQILAREEMAIANGELPDANNDGIAEGGYIQIFEKYFNQWQFSSNGLWEECSVDDKTVYFDAINGLMKISAVYNYLGIKINYADKAFECAAYIVALMGTAQDGSDWNDSKGVLPSSVVNVYNPWAAMSYLLGNVSKFYSADQAAKLRASIKEDTARLIDVTMRKIVKFKKDDGSYGYTWTYPPSTSQGADVSVPYVVEGDINGGIIAIVNTLSAMCSTLGIGGDLKPYAYSDLLVFASRVESLGPVIKSNGGDSRVAKQYTFDDDELDVAPNSVITKINKNAEFIVVADPEDELKTNRYVRYNVSPGGNHVYFNTQVGMIVSGNAFEFKIRFEEITKSSGFQIKLGDSYMFTVSATASGALKIGDLSNTSAGIATSFDGKFNAYEWNEIRVEFYVLDPEAKSTMAYIYVNGDLRFASTNYYKKEADERPILNYRQAHIYSLSSSQCVVYFDDVSAYQITGKYEEKPIVNPDRVKDFDNVTAGSGELPYGVTTVGGEVVSSPTDKNADNNIFVLDGKDKSVNVKSALMTASPNCYSATTRMKIEQTSVGVIGTIRLAGNTLANSIMVYEIEVYEKDSTKYARLTEVNSDGVRGSSYDDIPVGEWFTLTLEFYPYFYESDACAILYLEGKEIGRGKHYYKYGTIAKTYEQLIISTSADVKISLDDIIPEGIEKKFIDSSGSPVNDPNVVLPQSGNSSNTPATSGHDGIFDFENAELGTPAVPGLTTSVNRLDYGNNLDISTDPKNAVNKVLMHKVAAGTNGNSETYVVSKSAPPDANCYVYEFDVLASTIGTGITQIAIRGKEGNDNRNIFQASLYTTGDWMSQDGGTLQIIAKNDAASVSNSADVTQNPEYTFHNKTIVPKIKVYGWMKLRVEVYSEENIAQIYIDDEFRAEIASVYSVNAHYEYTNANLFTTAGTTMTMYIDNVRAEAIKKTYAKGNCDNISASAGEDYDPSKDEIETPPVTPPPEITPESPDGTSCGKYFDDASIKNGTKLYYDNLAVINRDNVLTSDSYSGTHFTASVVDGAMSFVGKGVTVGIRNSGAKIGEAYVFESYMLFDGATTGTKSLDNFAWFGMSAGGVGKDNFFLRLTFGYVADSDGNIEKINIVDSSNGTVASIPHGEWHNVRFIYCPDNIYESDGTTVASGGYKGILLVYIDDELVSSCTTVGAGSSVSNEQLNCIGFELRGYSYAGVSEMEYLFDNTFIGALASKEGIDPTIPSPDGTRYDGYFDDLSITNGTKLNYNAISSVTNDNILAPDSYTGTHFSASVTDKKLKLTGNGVSAGLKNSGAKNGTSYVFESYVSFDGTARTANSSAVFAWVGMSASGVAKSNYFLYLSLSYVTDENGNITSIVIKDHSSGTECARLDYNCWSNIRFIYTPNNTYESDGTTVASGGYKGDVEIYVNGEMKASFATSGAGGDVSNKQLNAIGFEFRGYSYSGLYEMNYYFDNTFIGTVNE